MQKKRIGFWRKRETEKENVKFYESEIIEDDGKTPSGEQVVDDDTKAPKTTASKKADVSNVVILDEDEEYEDNPPAPFYAYDEDEEEEASALIDDSDNPPAAIPDDDEETPVVKKTIAKKTTKAEPAAKSPEKKSASEPQPVEYRSKHPGTSTSLEYRQSVRATLSASRFDMDTNQRAKIISNKPKEIDPWAVATIVTSKPTAKTPAAKNKPYMEEHKTMAKEKAETKAPAAKTATKATASKSASATPAPAAKKAAEKPATKAPATKKEVVVEPVVEAETGSSVSGKFVIKRTDKDNFVFKLFSSNGRVVAISAGQYSALSSCKAGIQSVINNAATAPIEDQTLQKVVEQKCPKWIIFTDKKGEARLRLIASNGNAVAATNDGYTTKDAAKKGIEAIARAAKDAEIVRNDNLW